MSQVIDENWAILAVVLEDVTVYMDIIAYTGERAAREPTARAIAATLHYDAPQPLPAALPRFGLPVISGYNPARCVS